MIAEKIKEYGGGLLGFIIGASSRYMEFLGHAGEALAWLLGVVIMIITILNGIAKRRISRIVLLKEEIELKKLQDEDARKKD